MFEYFKKVIKQTGASEPPAPPLDNHTQDHHAEPVDCSIPGVKPDHSGLSAWVDHFLPTAKPGAAAAAPAAAPAAAKDPKEAAAEAKASGYAMQLFMQRNGTRHDIGLGIASMTKTDHYAFLNTLDSIDDPLVRAKTKEQFQKMTGQSLEDFINSTHWEGGRDKAQALDLISAKRDETERKLAESAAKDPAKHAEMVKNANAWAGQILASTRIDDADTKDNAQKIQNILGPRSPEEIELIRAAIRKNGGHGIYEELDRSLSGGKEDAAVDALKGDKVNYSLTALRTAGDDPKRIKEILRGLDKSQLADLKMRNAVFGDAWISHSVPEGADRAEIEKLLAGDKVGADGERIANLLKDPKDGLKLDGMQIDEQSKRNMEARDTKNVIHELESKSPEDLKAAAAAWNENAAKNGGKTFEQMLDDRFPDNSSTAKLRISALLHGDRAADKVIQLRDGMHKHNQAQIEEALENPDLKSNNPEKRKAAEEERARIEKLAQEQDAYAQRTVAMFTGHGDEKIEGRNLDAQLADHYQETINKPNPPDNLMEAIAEQVRPDETKKKREKEAHDNEIAATELHHDGRLSAETEFYRAEKKGDKGTEAKLLDGLNAKELEEAKAHYTDKYGGENHREMLRGPNLDSFQFEASMRQMRGDNRPLVEIEKELAHDDMDANELRIDNVRNYGAKSARSADLQFRLQKELADRQHSDSLESNEEMRASLGGSLGSEALVKTQLEVEDNMLEPVSGIMGAFMPRHLKEGVTNADFQQIDQNLTLSLETQREEKIKYANHMAAILTTIAKIAALAAGQPELILLIDAVSGLGAMALKKHIAGEAYDPAHDAKLLAINLTVDTLTLGIAKYGKGAVAAEEGAQAVQAEAGVAQGLASEASAAEGALIKDAGTAESMVAQASSEASVASKVAEAAEPGWKTWANLGVSSGGTIATDIVEGKSPTDILKDVVQGGLAQVLPAHLAGKVREALGDATKANRLVRELAANGVEFGANIVINADHDDAIMSAAMQTGGGLLNKALTAKKPTHANEIVDESFTAKVADESDIIRGAPEETAAMRVPSDESVRRLPEDATGAPKHTTETETSKPAGSATETPISERVTERAIAVPDLPAHERVTQQMQAVAPPSETAHRSPANANDTIRRSTARRAAMDPARQARHDAVFAAAENRGQQVLIERAIAAGRPVEQVEALQRAMAGKSEAEVLLEFSGHGLVQFYDHSCVPTAYQIAIAEVDPVAAMQMRENPAQMMAEQKALLDANGSIAAPRSDWGTPPEAFQAHLNDPAMGPVLSDPTRYQLGGGTEGVYTTNQPGQKLHSQLEGATGSPYEVITTTQRPRGQGEAPGSGSFDRDSVPHDRIQRSVDGQQPVIFTADNHAHVIVKTEIGPTGELLYIVSDPWHGGTYPMTASELARKATSFTLPAEMGPAAEMRGQNHDDGLRIRGEESAGTLSEESQKVASTNADTSSEATKTSDESSNVAGARKSKDETSTAVTPEPRQPQELLASVQKEVAGENPDHFEWTWSKSDAVRVIEEGRKLDLTDRQIHDLMRVAQRKDQPQPDGSIKRKSISPDEMIRQMHNYAEEVLPRQYPYRLESQAQFKELADTLRGEVAKAGLPSEDIRVQGSSLRKPETDDIDLAVFVEETAFDSHLINAFTGDVSEGGRPVALTLETLPELVANIRKDQETNGGKGYNAPARTMMRAFENRTMRVQEFPSLRQAKKALEKKFGKLGITIMTSGGYLDREPDMELP